MSTNTQVQLDITVLRFQEFRQLLKQLKKPIHQDGLQEHQDGLQEHHDRPDELHTIEYIFPVKSCEQIFNAICIITDQERLNRYLVTKRTNQWSMAVYLIVKPILSYIVSQLVVSFLFDFIKKSMIVSGTSCPIPLDGVYGRCCGMIVSSQMSSYVEVYVSNALKYYTCYNGHNCTLGQYSNAVKQFNWSLFNYIFNQVCFKLYRSAINPESNYRYLSFILLTCIGIAIMGMIQKIRIE